MAPEVTKMVIKVDLACEKCRKKIKKVLCDIPHIQNQVYDEKANTVTITVKGCSPDKVKQKICCKGGKTVKGIEIVKPPPPTKPEKPLEVEVEVAVELPKPPPTPTPCGPCCYCGCGRTVCNFGGSGCNKCYYPSGYTVYICEENPSACTIL